MKKLAIFILLFVLSSLTATAQVFVNESDVIISSPQEFYFCEPVISSEGCLIQTTTEITNNRPGSISPQLEFDANQFVSMRTFQDQSQSIQLVNPKGTNIRSVGNHVIFSGETKVYEVDFWIKDNGKYNFSVFFSGTRVTLDPFFNLSFNTSSPSIYLETGILDSYNDSQFITQTNITNELNDNSDATKFEIQKTNIPLLTTSATLIVDYSFDETSGTIMEDISDTANDGTYVNSPYLTLTGLKNTAVRFNTTSSHALAPSTGIFDLNSTEDIGVCFSYNSFGGNANSDPIIDHRDNANSGWEIRGANNELRFSTDFDGTGAKNFNTLYQFTDSNFHTVCFVANRTDITSYVDGSFDKTAPFTQSGALTGNLNNIYFGTDEDVTVFSDDGIDEFCYLKGVGLKIDNIATLYNDSLDCTQIVPQEVNGKALRTTYPISFNTDNTYKLLIRKSNTGVQNLNIHLYNEGTDSIQSLLTTDTITTGNDTVSLPITQNITASLRIYTDTPSNISELFLIEGIEDVTAPSVNSKSINNTLLTCDDTISLQSDITDDNSVQHVFFTYTDNSGFTYVEADKQIDTSIFYINKTYSHFTTGTEIYNFTSINATDLVDQSTIDNFLLQFNYSCIAVDTTAPDITLIVTNPSSPIANNGTTEPVSINFSSSEFPINVTLNLFDSGGSIVDTQGVFIINSSLDLPVTYIIPALAEGTYTLNQTSVDPTSNTAVDFVATITVTFIVTPPTGIVTLITPLNVTEDNDGYVTFNYNVNVTGNTTLFYISSLNAGSITNVETLFNVNGVNSFTPIAFTQNQSIQWWVNHSYNPIIMSEIFNLTINKTQLNPFEVPDSAQSLQAGVCAGTTQETLLLGLLTFIALVVLVIGFAFKRGFVTIFGALMLMTISWLLAACFLIFALILGGFSLVMIIYSAVSNIGFDDGEFT